MLLNNALNFVISSSETALEDILTIPQTAIQKLLNASKEVVRHTIKTHFQGGY